MLSDDVTRYVALYRRLGRSFAEQSRTLHLYALYAGAQGDSHVRIAPVSYTHLTLPTSDLV